MPPKRTKKTPGKKIIEDIEEENIFAKYKSALSTTNIPTNLVFREKENEEIKNFLTKSLKLKKSSSIYVSGKPGTGKTASVNSILNELENRFSFDKVLINGMSCSSQNILWKKILKDLNYTKKASKNIINNVIEELSSDSNKMRLLILDEIDILNTKHQEMLYEIFNLPNYDNTKVIIVGIANTLDLTKKLKRHQSLDFEPMKEVIFYPYDDKMIFGIIKERIKDLEKDQNLIPDSTILFCSKKVAALTGDVRKALEIMRRSVELVEEESLEKENVMKNTNKKVKIENEAKTINVQISHVNKVINTVFANKNMKKADKENIMPFQEQLILCVILILLKNKKKEHFLIEYYDKFLQVCKSENFSHDIANVENFLNVCELLETKSFITIKKAKEFRKIKISLNMVEEEAIEMFEDKIFLKSVLSKFT